MSRIGHYFTSDKNERYDAPSISQCTFARGYCVLFPDGFVKTKDVLKESELRNYSAAVDSEVAARTASDTRSLVEKTTYEQSFIQCMRLWETQS